MIQDRNNGGTILDSDVEVSAGPLIGADLGATSAHATRAQGQNKLLEATALELPKGGTWELHVSARRGEQFGSIECPVQAMSFCSRGRDPRHRNL